MPRGTNAIQPSFFHFIVNKNLDELYIAIALRFFAISMIGIFLPIYLIYELKYSLPEVIFFFIISATVLALSSILGAKISVRIGFKHVVLVSVPFTLTFFLLLLMLPNHNIPLWLIALVGSFALGLYWIGHHSNLTKFTIKEARGSQVGLAFFVLSTAVLLGPLIGGLILTYFNFIVLFSVASIILLSSTIPLSFTREKYRKDTFSFKAVLKQINLKDAFAFIAQGMEIGAYQLAWPLFIFIILGEYLNLGLVGSLSAFLAAIASVLIGKLSDRFGKRPFLRFGASSLMLLWIMKTFVIEIAHVFIATFFVFLRSNVAVPMDSLAYTKARISKKIEEYLVFRELFLGIGKIITYLILLISSSYILTFVATGISQLLLFLF